VVLSVSKKAPDQANVSVSFADESLAYTGSAFADTPQASKGGSDATPVFWYTGHAFSKDDAAGSTSATGTEYSSGSSTQQGVPPTDAGIYVVHMSLPATSEYEAAEDATFEFTISRVELDMDLANVTFSKRYDATDKAMPSVSISLDGAIGQDDVAIDTDNSTFKYYVHGSTTQTSAGSATDDTNGLDVRADTIVLKGDSAANYLVDFTNPLSIGGSILATDHTSLTDSIAGAEDKIGGSGQTDGIAIDDPMGDNYTQDTWQDVVDAYDDANTINNDADATQPEVDNAEDALDKAIDDLVSEHPLIEEPSHEVISGGTVYLHSYGKDIAFSFKGYIASVSSLSVADMGFDVVSNRDPDDLQYTLKDPEGDPSDDELGTIKPGSAVVDIQSAWADTLADGTYPIVMGFDRTADGGVDAGSGTATLIVSRATPGTGGDGGGGAIVPGGDGTGTGTGAAGSDATGASGTSPQTGDMPALLLLACAEGAFVLGMFAIAYAMIERKREKAQWYRTLCDILRPVRRAR
jgi:hypothetical protein